MKWVSRRAVGLIIVALCAALWFVVVPTFVEGEQQRFFPKVVVAWIAVFGALTALAPPKANASDDEVPFATPESGAPPEATPRDDERFPSVYGLMVVWATYVLVMGSLGFYLATFLMLSVSMFYLGVRSVWTLLLHPTAALVVMYLLLDLTLNFRLPEAFWQ